MNHIAVSPDIEPVPDTSALRTRLLAGISFGLAGLLLNLCDVELLPGISLLFGSILSLFTLLRYGPVAGLIATLLASSATLLLFGHAWTLLLSTVELLAVTWLLRQRRIEPVLAMLCYWALFGWLLSFGVHYYFVEISLADARLLALKQAVNGTFNMMAAQSAYLLSRRLLERKPEPVKIHTLLFTIIGLAAVVPIMIHMVLDVRSSYRAAVQSLQRDVEHAEALTTALMREWLDERKQAVQAVARLVELAHTQDTNHLRYMLIEAVAGDGPLTRLLLLDANNRVLALGVRPGVHAEVRVGQDMSRVAFAELLKTRKNLQITDLFNGKGGGSLPRIAAVVPVWKHGRYQRGVVATFDFDSLRELLKKVAGQHRVDITLLDGQNLIIASTRPELVTMEPYQQLTGQVRQLQNSRIPLIMPSQQQIPLLANRQARYCCNTPLAADSNWSIVVEVSLQATVDQAVVTTSQTLRLLAVIILLSVLISWLVARRVASPLSDLEQATRQMLLGSNDQVSGLFGTSAIVEIDRLTQHLQWLVAELQRRHQSLLSLNVQLEDQVQSRTARLRELMQEQQIILDNASVGIALITNRGVVWMNPRLYEVLGYPLEEVYDDVRVVYPSQEEYERVGSEAYPVLERGGVYRDELQMVRYDGSLIWIRMHGKAVEQGNQALGNIWTFEDINDRKQAELELLRLKEHLQEQVAFRTAELRDSHERLKELSSHLTTIRESERLSVAREIHDVLGAALTAISFDIAWFCRNYGGREAIVDERLARMEETVQQSVIAVRRIATELRPWLLDDLGLAAAMQGYLDQLEARTGITTSLQIEPSVHETCPLVREHAVNIYRIFQEALTNVARHAAATAVTVQLQCTGTALLLKIEDNGCGISGETLRNRQSFGIAGMRERARMVGANLHISCLTSGGTALVLTLPQPGGTTCPHAISR